MSVTSYLNGALLVALATVCVVSSHADVQKTLYQRLGGREGLQPIVSDFVEMVIRNPRVRLNSSAKKYMESFKPSDLKAQLFDVACEASGGPCKAPGARVFLRKSLQAMELTASDWDAVKKDCSAAMAKFKVPAPEQSELRAMMSGLDAVAITDRRN